MKGMIKMDKYWVWFSRVNKIGAKAQNELLEIYKTPEKIWNLTKKELKKNLNDIQASIILDKTYRKDLEKYMDYMKKHNIKMLTIHDEKYPQKLRNIYDPPIVLYIIGNENIINNKSIAIIGSRMCTDYGMKMASNLAYNLSKNNINVISGLAKGIDTYAHLGAIRADKTTIAVIGSGLDIIYPRENKKIYESIVKKGAIVSEYIIGTKPEKINFPARNRIISGLCDGVLVVEASPQSGTAITVDFALEQGKNIYAVPGNINSYTSIRNK